MLGAISARRDRLLRASRLCAHPAAAVAVIVAAIAVADIAALPSAHGSASIPTATPVPPPAPAYRGALAEPAQPASAAAASEDPAARRFTGIVGANLSDALLRAGVPERRAANMSRSSLKRSRLPMASALPIASTWWSSGATTARSVSCSMPGSTASPAPMSS